MVCRWAEEVGSIVKGVWKKKSEGGMKLGKGTLPDFSSLFIALRSPLTPSPGIQTDGGVFVKSIAWEYLLIPWSKRPQGAILHLSDWSSQQKPSREPSPSTEVTLLGGGKLEPVKLTLVLPTKCVRTGQLIRRQSFWAAVLKTAVVESFLWGCRVSKDIKAKEMLVSYGEGERLRKLISVAVWSDGNESSEA